MGGAIAVVIGAFSVSGTAPELTALIAVSFDLPTADAAEIVRLLTDLATSAGGLLAVYGRVRATRAITMSGGD